MEKSVLDAIERFSLLENTNKVTVALSGGADSMALLYSLYSLQEAVGINLKAAHLNHLSRGDEAFRDEAFVKEICDKLGIELTVKRVDVPNLAKEQGISTELAARKARYEFLEEVADGGAVATAHTASDNLETVILPCSIRDLSVNLFSNCINLTTITISNSVTRIPFNTFLNCSSLTSLTIPSSVIEIENGAFSGTGLTSVVIPRSVNNIWGTAFSNCNNLVTAKFENPTNWRLSSSPDKVDITPGFSEDNAEILKSIVSTNHLLRG